MKDFMKPTAEELREAAAAVADLLLDPAESDLALARKGEDGHRADLVALAAGGLAAGSSPTDAVEHAETALNAIVEKVRKRRAERMAAVKEHRAGVKK